MQAALFRQREREFFIELAHNNFAETGDGLLAGVLIGCGFTWHPDRTWTVFIPLILIRVAFGWVDSQ